VGEWFEGVELNRWRESVFSLRLVASYQFACRWFDFEFFVDNHADSLPKRTNLLQTARIAHTISDTGD